MNITGYKKHLRGMQRQLKSTKNEETAYRLERCIANCQAKIRSMKAAKEAKK